MHPFTLAAAVPLGLTILLAQLAPAVPGAIVHDVADAISGEARSVADAYELPQMRGAALMKCGRFAGPTPLHVLDAAFTDRNPRDLDMQSVDRIELLCWDRERRVLQRGEGDPVIYIVTHAFRKTLLGALQSLAGAQDTYHAQHGRYAGELGELRELSVTDVPAGIDVALSTAASGWQAVATGPLFIEQCTVSHDERTPDCVTLDRFAR
jgi:hypothetical protein